MQKKIKQKLIRILIKTIKLFFKNVITVQIVKSEKKQ